VRPPFPYYGGKMTLAGRIAAVLPAHGHYVEPFAGSLAVLLAKPPSRMETVNDLDGDLVNHWRVLRERPEDLARACALTPHSRAEWEASRDDHASGDELERARRFWTAVTQARSNRLTRAGWRHYVDPGATGTAFPEYLDAYVDRMAAAAARMHHVSLECRPATELVERYGAHRDVLLYVDPPYLGETRSNDRAYRHELMTPDEHRELAVALHGCAAAVVISGYPSPLYDTELYAGWDRLEIPSGTGQGPNGWSNRTEVLWCNRRLNRQQVLDFTDEEATA
jgi:DNA adenine methylase